MASTSKPIFEAIVGDMFELEVEALVNPANPQLYPGGGVSGQIHGLAGPELTRECREIGRVEVGQVVITNAYNLYPVKKVIHTAGPIYGNHEGKEAELLASCYFNSLALAEEHGLRSIAFPAISTGIYRYPFEEAAAVATKSVRDYFSNYPESTIERVVFALRIPGQDEYYQQLLNS